jgi:FkbM family methyltransferase
VGESDRPGLELKPDDVVAFVRELAESNPSAIANQDFFDLIRGLALFGMGYGHGDAVATSGEFGAMHYAQGLLKARYPGQVLNIFDVGANIGEFIAMCHSVFGAEERRYVCFEPSAATFASLIKATKDRSEITTLQMALGDTPGDLTLYTDTAGSGLASVYKRQIAHFGIDMAMSETVKVSTLDLITAELGVERIHYLKLDVEGHELQCLKGGERLLGDGCVDFVQFEFGGANIDSRTYFRDFWILLKDYTIYRVLKDGLFHIGRYSETEEIFSTTNYLACRRF